jgi:hypothetical protein
MKKDIDVYRKGDANPAHLPRLGSLLCTWIRAGHLGSCAGQPGSGTRLSPWLGADRPGVSPWLGADRPGVSPWLGADRPGVSPWLGVSWALTLSSTSSTRPQLGEAVLNGLFP